MHRSRTQPLCRYCGKPIRKYTTTVRFVAERKPHMFDDRYARYVIGLPTTRAEAQRLVNEQVVSVRYGQDPWNRTAGEYIHQAGVWDGESYVDAFFCSGAHAEDFGYLMARAGHGTTDFDMASRKNK